MYMNMLQINELIEDIGPLPALINNPIFGGYRAMTTPCISQPLPPKQQRTLSYMKGKKFGRLTVVGTASPHVTKKGAKYEVWHCRCECGNEVDVMVYALFAGNTQSCGCLHKDGITTHDLYFHPLNKVWSSMKSRCYRKADIGYPDYGGRGISVCDEWVNDFKMFYNWATANGWKKELQIDRINNDGNYEPSNCHFVTHCENSRHRRSSKLTLELAKEIREFERNNPKITNAEIGKMYGIHANTVSDIKFNRIWKKS